MRKEMLPTHAMERIIKILNEPTKQITIPLEFQRGSQKCHGSECRREMELSPFDRSARHGLRTLLHQITTGPLMRTGKVAVKRMSRLLAPTIAVKIPSCICQLWLAESQVENARLFRGNVTSSEDPFCTNTFLKPLSCFGGSPAFAGKPRYNCGTSAPSRLPMFV